MLIACANFFPIESMYHRKGKIEETSEIVSLLKTKKELRKTVEQEIQTIHPYETPCIIKIEAEANKDYQERIQNETL